MKTNTEYHAEDGYVSSSMLKHFIMTAKKFAPPVVEKGYFDFGTAFHTMALERDNTNNIACIDAKRSSEQFKSLKRPDMTNVTKDELETIVNMLKAMRNNENVKHYGLLPKNGDIIEQSYYATLYGVKCKARPDLLSLNADGTYNLIDYKTTNEDITVQLNGYSNFKNKIRKLNYLISMAFYKMVLQHNDITIKDSYFLAVDTNCKVLVVNISDDAMELNCGMVADYLNAYSLDKISYYDDNYFITV